MISERLANVLLGNVLRKTKSLFIILGCELKFKLRTKTTHTLVYSM